ncbi:MAG: hypothetical protein AB1782_05085 [Cyanobacteriota bacterium]
MTAPVSNNFSGIYASLSGMRAGMLMQDIASANIANMYSEDYYATRVELSSAATGGVLPSLTIDETPPIEVTNTDGSTQKLSNVDLTNEIFNIAMGSVLFSASAAAYNAQAQSIGTIINMKA